MIYSNIIAGLMQQRVAFVLFVLILFISFMDLFSKKGLKYKFGFSPYHVVRKGEYYRFITSMFVHGDIFHLAFNLFTYYYFAFPLESYLGSLNFSILFFSAQVGGQLYDFVRWKNHSNYLSIGASAAILGAVFSFVAFSPTMTFYFIIVPLPAWLFALLFLGYSFYSAKSYAGGINHYAHILGASIGFFLTFVLEPNVFYVWKNLLLRFF